jgi:hypothetical protein
LKKKSGKYQPPPEKRLCINFKKKLRENPNKFHQKRLKTTPKNASVLISKKNYGKIPTNFTRNAPKTNFLFQPPFPKKPEKPKTKNLKTYP